MVVIPIQWKEYVLKDFDFNKYLKHLIQVVTEEIKRFDQLNQGYKKSETSSNETGEKKPVNQNKKTLDETKKHLGFQWDIPNK